MIDTQTETICEMSVTVTQLTARKSLQALRRLGSIVGPSLKELGGAFEGGVSLESVSIGAAAGAVGDFLQRMTDADLQWCIDTFLETAVIDNKPVNAKNFDVIFTGRIEAIFPVLWFALKVNYKNFFSALPLPAKA